MPVVHDGKTLVSHGPPSSWAPGVAQRVQNGALQLGVVRVRLAVDNAESRDALSLAALSLSTPPLAARRLAAGRLKVGVHVDRGGLDYMEDESVVHTTADFAFFCVYDGHGGTPGRSDTASSWHAAGLASRAGHLWPEAPSHLPSGGPPASRVELQPRGPRRQLCGLSEALPQAPIPRALRFHRLF